MIPLKLSLRNFLSYGSKIQEIDFGTHPLICFSGKNGHGKSALLDAMTWVIWGQARKIGAQAKPDIHLLKLGQSSMIVTLDFLCNDQTFRIKREFAIGKHAQPYSSLEFGIYKNGSIKPLTEKTIRATQATIEKTIGISYETFTHSAFLRQGNANEFSKKSPKERKEILAQILQLNNYDTLKKAAADKARLFGQEKTFIQQKTAQLENEIGLSTHIDIACQLLQFELTALDKEEKEQQQKVHTLDKNFQEIDKQLSILDIFITKKNSITHEIKQAYNQCIDNFNSWKMIHKQLVKVQKIDPIQQKELLAKINNMQEIQNQLLVLKQKFLAESEKKQLFLAKQTTLQDQEKQKLMLAQERLEGEQKKAQALIKQPMHLIQHNQKEYAELTLKHNALEKELLHINQLTKDFAIYNKQFEKRKLYYHTWVARLQHLEDQYKELQHKKRFTHDIHNPSCPMCEQNLSASRKKFLFSLFCKQENSLQHRKQRLVIILKTLKPLLLEQHKVIKNLQDTLLEKQNLETLLKETKDKLEKIQHTIQHYTLEIATQERFIISLSQEAERLHKDLLALDQAPIDEHIQLQKRAHEQTIETLQIKITHIEDKLSSYSSFYQDWLALQELMKHQELVEEKQKLKEQHFYAFCSTKNTIKHLRKEIFIFDEQLQQYPLLTQKKTILKEKLTQQLTSCEYIQKIKSQLHRESAYYEMKKQHITDQKKQLEILSIDLMRLQEEEYDYTFLSSMFSKDGIQALLIEDALPEIEHEANFLLSQLTHNQAHIIIESLRDLKKGGIKETLDINISDTLGIRPYELFSGGEAFRIDFALRIAISKLLARRAGTSLQTLIIDEGFGSQDDDGISLLMDAIHKIQDNFAKIIIVSHLPMMKEQFPVHFMINKTAQGSNVNIISH